MAERMNPPVCASMRAARNIERIAGLRGESAFSLYRKTGVSRTHIWKLFRAGHGEAVVNPTIDTLEKIAEALHVDVRDILEPEASHVG